MILVIGVLLFLQILLGALVRHSGAGASCGLGIENAFLCTDSKSWLKLLWPNEAQAKLHMTHRLFGMVMGVVSFVVPLVFLKKIKTLGLPAELFRKIYTISWLIPLFVLLQVLLGVLTVALNISIIPTTLHLAIAAICLTLFWKLYL